MKFVCSCFVFLSAFVAGSALAADCIDRANEKIIQEFGYTPVETRVLGRGGEAEFPSDVWVKVAECSKGGFIVTFSLPRCEGTAEVTAYADCTK